MHRTTIIIQIIFAVATLFGGPAFARDEAPTTPATGISVEEYQKRMVAHRMLVMIICQEIVGLVPNADSDHMLERCQHHDDAKMIEDAEFLKKHHVNPDKSIASWLAEKFGIRFPMNQANRDFIHETNRVDDEVEHGVDVKHSTRISGVAIKAGEDGEKAADLTARHLWDLLFPKGRGIVLENGLPGTALYERDKPFYSAYDFLKPGGEGHHLLDKFADKEIILQIIKDIEDPRSELGKKIRLRAIKEITPEAIRKIWLEQTATSAYSHPQAKAESNAAKNGNAKGKNSASGSDAENKCIQGVISALEAL